MSNQGYQSFTIDLDLTETQAWDGEDRPLLPEGVGYHFKIVDVKNDGKQMTTKNEVLDGEHAGSFAWTNYNFQNDVGLKRIKALAVAVGAGLGRINSDEFLGATYYGDIVHRDGQAKPDASGNVRPAKTFANIIRERASLDGEGGGEGQAEADPTPPPITRAAPAPEAPAKKGGARRA